MTALATSAPPALDVVGLQAGYGRFDVIHDVSLAIASGEAIGLVGPNGAGKTTMIRAILGLAAHRTGSVRVSGVDIGGMPVHKVASGYVGLVPEGRRLFAGLSVEDNLLLGALHLRRQRSKVSALLESVYDVFPVLRTYRHRNALALSGGEQQMVAIGRMMMGDPALMLLDEPSVGLAPLAVEAVGSALLGLREQGRSLLLAEQRVDLALRICDRLCVLSGGRIVREMRCTDVDPASRTLIDEYLG